MLVGGYADNGHDEGKGKGDGEGLGSSARGEIAVASGMRVRL